MRNSVVDFLYETVMENGQKTGVAGAEGGLTFEDLFRRAYGLATRIRIRGANAPVMVYLPKGIDAVVSFAGILLSGNFYAPVDLRSPGSRMQKILSNLAPAAIVTRREFEKDLCSLGAEKSSFLFWEDVEREDDLSLKEMITECKIGRAHV